MSSASSSSTGFTSWVYTLLHDVSGYMWKQKNYKKINDWKWIFYPNINLLFHADKCRQTRAFHRFYSKLIWVISLDPHGSSVLSVVLNLDSFLVQSKIISTKVNSAKQMLTQVVFRGVLSDEFCPVFPQFDKIFCSVFHLSVYKQERADFV